MSKPKFIHALRTVQLQTLTSPPVSLAEFTTPHIPPFHSNPLLFNGHLQTVWSVSKLSDPYPIHYARRLFTNPGADGGTFAVDFVTDVEGAGEGLPERTRDMTKEEEEGMEKGNAEDERPMLVALHGLSGGSHEKYLRAVLALMVEREEGEGKWSACAINARGCAMSKISTSQLFNARFTEDVRFLLRYFKGKFPKRPLFAVGFSLGANILTNYLGEEGASTPLTGAVVISNPWSLELTDKALHRTFLGHHIYSRAMGTGLRNLYMQHASTLLLDPRVSPTAHTRMVHARDFDSEVTCRILGYATVGAYYRAASCVDNLLKVAVPTLVLHAADDPIAVDEAVPYDEAQVNPYVVMAVTQGGGHLGWFESSGERWFARAAVGWLEAMGKEGVKEGRWKVPEEGESLEMVTGREEKVDGPMNGE